MQFYTQCNIKVVKNAYFVLGYVRFVKCLRSFMRMGPDLPFKCTNFFYQFQSIELGIQSKTRCCVKIKIKMTTNIAG